jgi:phosphoribosylamine--glycine ligase
MSERSALVVGGGGREHQLGLSIAGSVDTVYFAPGNAGTTAIENGINLPEVSTIGDVIDFVDEKECELTIIGPEQPLVQGIVNGLEGHAVFGPSAEAAQLEGSKIFATEFMREYDIPYPYSDIINSDEDRIKLLHNLPLDNEKIQQLVFKADGLAGGKGAILPKDWSDAVNVLHGMFSGKMFDGAGKDIVLQERLHGPEVSVFVICDGERYSILPFSQDHKRLKNDDEGPNTGGMGAYAPVPESIVNYAQQEKIDDIVHKTIAGTLDRGMPYKGVLYIGMMLAEERNGDPVVIEYNVRFGDPETQAVLPLIERAGIDVYDLLRSSAEGHMEPESFEKIHQLGSAALTVCLAAEGYPDSPRKGNSIHGLEQGYPNVIVQHGGTKKDGSRIVTAGGRVLYVTGLGETVDEAAAHAYAAIGEKGIHFDGMQYRTDIGHQARG